MIIRLYLFKLSVKIAAIITMPRALTATSRCDHARFPSVVDTIKQRVFSHVSIALDISGDCAQRAQRGRENVLFVLVNLTIDLSLPSPLPCCVS